MDINAAFPSKYLRAADLNGQAVQVTIDRVELDDVGQGVKKERKPIVYFVGKQKGLVLNKTNGMMITKIAQSSDTDDWHGVEIRLVSAEVEFQGELMQALRVREPRKSAAPVKAKPKPEPIEDVPAELTDDEIPF